MTTRSIILAAVLAGCASLPSNAAAGQSACRAAAPRSNVLIGELREWMTTSDPERIADRDTLFKIPYVNPDDISLVTDAAICAKVATAFVEPHPLQVFVIKLGNKGYAALDPTRTAGEFEMVVIFDRKFKRIGGWTG